MTTRSAETTTHLAAPEGGAVAPEAGAVAPDGGAVAPEGGAVAPDGGAVAPDASPEGRDSVLDELATLSLPLMWSLRQAAVRLYEPLGLRPTRVLVLELIACGIDRPGELADALDTVPAAVTAILNELDGRGLVERRVDEADRRRTRLRVTDAGTSLLDSARTRWCEATRARLDGIPMGDVEAMLRTVRALLVPADGDHAS